MLRGQGSKKANAEMVPSDNLCEDVERSQLEAMKFFSSTILLFIFAMILSGCACANSQNDVTSSKAKLRPIEIFQRKLKNLWSWIQSKIGNEDTFIGRCIGGFKKLRMAINFIVFKLGVIVTALAFISALLFKSVGIGVILLIISSIGLFSKISLLKHGSQHHDSGQTVHFHLHGKGGHYNEIPHYSWHDREDIVTYRNELEKQAVIDMYKRIGLSRHIKYS